ncbi:MAG: polysaccharide deacetylase family protein [Candidatus Limnocylindrales bacterium]
MATATGRWALVVVLAIVSAGCAAVASPGAVGSAAPSTRLTSTAAQPTGPPAGWPPATQGQATAAPAATFGAEGTTLPGQASATPGATAAPQSAPPSAPPSVVPLPGPAGTDVVFRVPILMYHRIIDPSLAPGSLAGLCVPPAVFQAQMDALVRAGWRPITMATLAADLMAGTPPPARTFVITIDDGHRDGLTNALPILVRDGLVATYYVVTGRLGRAANLHPGDLATLAAAGMEIGDHTVDHVNLARLSGPALALQIGAGADRIAALVGSRPITFAYPFGDRSPAVIAAVRAAGLLAAVTNEESGPVSATNRFLLPRLEVRPTTTPSFLLAEMLWIAG